MRARKKTNRLDDLDLSSLEKVRKIEFLDVDDLSLIEFRSNPEVFQPERAKMLMKSILLEGRVVEPIEVIVRPSNGSKSFVADCVEGRHRVEGMRLVRAEVEAQKARVWAAIGSFEGKNRARVEVIFGVKYDEYNRGLERKQAKPTKGRNEWVFEKVQAYFSKPTAIDEETARDLLDIEKLRESVEKNWSKQYTLPVRATLVPAGVNFKWEEDVQRGMEVVRAKELHKQQLIIDRGQTYLRRKNEINPQTARRFTDAQIAECFGVDRRTVQRAIAALSLPEEVKDFIRSNRTELNESPEHANMIPNEVIHRHVSAYALAERDWFEEQKTALGIDSGRLSNEQSRILADLRKRRDDKEVVAAARAARAKEILRFLRHEAKTGQPHPDCSWLIQAKKGAKVGAAARPTTYDPMTAFDDFLNAWQERYKTKSLSPKQAKELFEEVLAKS